MTGEFDLRALLLTAGLRILEAVVVLLIGRWIAAFLQRSARSLLKRTTLTPALTEIITRSVYYIIYVIAILTAFVILGVPADILIAALGILIVVAAIALRESLRDLAATVNFVIFQPFKTGDVIQTNGVIGKVREILLFQTVLVSSDNQQVIIPNGNIQNNNIVNLSALPENRLNLSVSLSYSDDLKATKEALLEIANADARVLQNPAPVVHVMDLGEGQVQYVLRVYTHQTDLWELQPALNERIKLMMEQRRLTVPLSQLQLHTDQSITLRQADQHTDTPAQH